MTQRILNPHPQLGNGEYMGEPEEEQPSAVSQSSGHVALEGAEVASPDAVLGQE